MAFLRFTRDKRGYESTFLLQNVRSDGATRSRVLYWFRTPPNVKVGRAVLDEDAIRLIEEANPGIEIEWSKVLKAKAPPPPRATIRERKPQRRVKTSQPDPSGRVGSRAVRPGAPPAVPQTDESVPDVTAADAAVEMPNHLGGGLEPTILQAAHEMDAPAWGVGLGA